MIDWIVVALLQAVAGEPTPPAPAPEPAAAEQPGGGAEPTAPAATATDPAPTPPAEQQYREERVCERLDVSTGERMPRRRCRTIRVPIEPQAEPEAAPQ
ncbi:MAG: hypothetical protein K2X34_00385 [Hyphomonadaceae bacterium]|nr:hypothetical protein [Hyphomonadaceae bacterium]